MFDVVVIGGGLAGCIAAMAASAQGAKVAVASRSWGATAMSTGALDIAYEPALSAVHEDRNRTLSEHLHDIVLHRPRHPYGVLGVNHAQRAIMQGYALLRHMLVPADLEPPHLTLTSSNVALASSLGGLISAGLALKPASGLDFSQPFEGTLGVLQFRGYAGFDAQRVCLGLVYDVKRLYGFSLQCQVVNVPWDGPKNTHAMAHAFDDEAVSLRVARDLATRCQGLSALLVPPVLGVSRTTAVMRNLRDAIGIPVVEALAHLPSVPGVRLQRALAQGLRAAGVTELGEVQAPEVEGTRVRSVQTTDGLTVEANAFVLSTGRFISGGVTDGKEALFGLPLVTELGALETGSPLAVVRETPVESHPLMTAGIKVTRDLNPILEGRIAYKNLFAAGMVIGGFASRYALCADGVSLATGFIAGENAARMGG